MPRKVWSKMRSKVSRERSATLSVFWGIAIAGSPALRAALIRAAMGEGPQELPLAYAALVLDLTKLYESLSVCAVDAESASFSPLSEEGTCDFRCDSGHHVDCCWIWAWGAFG
eukprot:1251290-Pyramimonas_sp.AAC.1